MARGRPAARGRKVINNLRWLGGTAFTFARSAGSTGVTILAAGVPRETIMRTRGEILVAIDAPQANPSGPIQVSLGLVLVPEGQGSTVIWDPFGDSEAPWFWYQETMIAYEEMVTDVIAVQGAMFHRIILDSKAMRRAGVDEEVQFVATNTTLGTAMTVNISGAFRFLLGN